MLAKQVKTVFIGVDDGVEVSDEVSKRFLEETGIELLTQREAYINGLGQAREYSMLSNIMSEQLNGSARVRISQTNPLVYWIQNRRRLQDTGCGCHYLASPKPILSF